MDAFVDSLNRRQFTVDDVSLPLILELFAVREIPWVHLYHRFPFPSMDIGSVIANLLSSKIIYTTNSDRGGKPMQVVRLTEQGHEVVRQGFQQYPDFHRRRDEIFKGMPFKHFRYQMDKFSEPYYLKQDLTFYNVLSPFFSNFMQALRDDADKLGKFVRKNQEALVGILEYLYPRYKKATYFYYSLTLVKYLTELEVQLEFSKPVQDAFILAKLSKGDTGVESREIWKDMEWPEAPNGDNY